jgi:hypothetical protein
MLRLVIFLSKAESPRCCLRSLLRAHYIKVWGEPSSPHVVIHVVIHVVTELVIDEAECGEENKSPGRWLRNVPGLG